MESVMSATFADKGVAEPRFAVGDAVWVVEQTTADVSHPCPDCLGTGEWDAVSPAGNTIKIKCPRCASNYSGYEGVHGDKLPPLAYRKTVFTPRAETVQGIEIRDTAWGSESRVAYRVKQNGGHWNEQNVYASHDEAATAAAIKQADADAKVEASPQAITVGRFASVTMREATIKLMGEILWSGWYRARNLTDEAESYFTDDGGYTGYSWSERAEMYLEEVRRTNPYIDYGPMEKLMDGVAERSRSDRELAVLLAAAQPQRRKADEE